MRDSVQESQRGDTHLLYTQYIVFDQRYKQSETMQPDAWSKLEHALSLALFICVAVKNEIVYYVLAHLMRSCLSILNGYFLFSSIAMDADEYIIVLSLATLFATHNLNPKRIATKFKQSLLKGKVWSGKLSAKRRSGIL